MKLLSALIPRLIILSLLLLLVWFNLPRIAERFLVEEIQRETGTLLNVGDLAKTGPLSRWYMSQIDWLDPRFSALNLLQADEAFVSLSAEALWRRQLRVEQLQLTQVRLATPRTITSKNPLSAHDRTMTVDLTAPPLQRVQFNRPQIDIPQQWIDRISHPQLGYQDGVSGLQRKMKEFETQWLAKAHEANQRVVDVQTELTRLEQENANQGLGSLPNPLRKAGDEASPATRLASLRQEKSTIEQGLSAFRTEMAALQIELERFRAEVDQAMRTEHVPETLDADLANQLVIGPMIEGLAQQWLNWVEHFRDIATKFEQPDLRPFNRGRNILFRGMSPQPLLQIDTMEISGAAQLVGQRIGLAGTIHNLSSAPNQQASPTKFKLRAQAEQHWLIEAAIDRRDTTQLDTLTIHCPASPVPGMEWGRSSVLSMETGPATQQIAAEFRLVGDEIEGEVNVTYSDLVFIVNHLHEMLGGQNVQLLLNHELASQNQVTARAVIRGPRNRPHIELSSDWGQQFANHYNRIQATSAELVRRQQAEKILNELEQELNRIRLSTGGKVDQVTQKLNEGSQVFAKLEAWEQEQLKAGRLR